MLTPLPTFGQEKTNCSPALRSNSLFHPQNLNETLNLLADKGILDSAENERAVAVIESRMTDVWNYLCEISPNRELLNFLVVPNDYHNLKTSLKAIVSRADDTAYFIKPCLLPPESIYNAVSAKKFAELRNSLSKRRQRTDMIF